MYWITPLINGSLMALFIVIFVVAGRLSNAFLVYDIAVSQLILRILLSKRYNNVLLILLSFIIILFFLTVPLQTNFLRMPCISVSICPDNNFST